MEITFLAAIVAGIQGISLGTVLLSKNKYARPLALLLIMLGIYALVPMFITEELISSLAIVFSIIISLPIVFAPVFYYHINKVFLQNDYRMGKHIFFFVPYFMVVLGAVYFILIGEFVVRDHGFFRAFEVTNIYLNGLTSLSQVLIGVLFMILALRKIRIWSNSSESLSHAEKLRLSWIKHMVFLFALAYVILSIFIVVHFLTRYTGVDYYLMLGVYVGEIAFIYYMTHSVFKYTFLFDIRKPQRENPESINIDSVIRSIEHELKVNEIYLEDDITLTKLAEIIGINRNELSFAVNYYYKTSFPRLISRYRLEHFIKYVKAKKDKSVNILEAAIASGFSSKTNFNRIFRDQYGLTPSEYMQKLNSEESSVSP